MTDGGAICPVCGYATLSLRCDWEICPVCFWEDDVLFAGQDVRSPANGGMWLSEAQANFEIHGACHPDNVRQVRPPRPAEERSPDWKLLRAAVLRIGKLREES